MIEAGGESGPISARDDVKIDIHCHTTNRRIPDVAPLSASLSAIRSEMKRYNVEKTVVLATYFPHRTSGITNFRLLNWIQEANQGEIKNQGESDPHHDGPFLMFGSLDFAHYFFQGLSELEELAEKKLMHGIKIYTCYQDIDIRGDPIKDIASLANRFFLPLMFHCGYAHGRNDVGKEIAITDSVKPSHLEWIAEEYPHLPIVISHLADPSTEDLITVVNRHNNVFSDMSGLINSRYEFDESPEFVEKVKALSVEQIRRFANECGPRKLLFGTDFPIQTHKDSIAFVEEGMKGFEEPDKSLVYYHNARWMLHCKSSP